MSHFNSDPEHPDCTVAKALDINIEQAAALPRYDPSNECPPPLPKRALRGQYRSRAEVDQRLDPFRGDALAGVSDELIGRRVGLTKEIARQWRRRQGIGGRRGRLHLAEGARYQLDALLTHDVGPLVQLAASSPTHGRWRPPEYVLRRPLKYDAFVEVVVYGVERFTVGELAEALGFEERDLLVALALHNARGKH